jgi:ribosomal protein S26
VDNRSRDLINKSRYGGQRYEDKDKVCALSCDLCARRIPQENILCTSLLIKINAFTEIVSLVFNIL